jgi:RHS repeat-associated protein
MTDASGVPQRRYDYLPFGWDIQSGYGNRSTVAGYVVSDKVNPKFTGKERDYETGLDLDYFGARYYSGAQGRFTTADWSATPQPVPYAKFDDPQTLNLYAYVRNNPLSRVDLDGHGDCRTSLKGCTSRGSHASGTAPAVGAPGTQLVHDANVRGGYTARAQGALTEKGQWSPVREGAKVEARAAQSGIADGVVAISVKNSEGVTRGLTATTTNPAVNALAEGMRPAGQALVVTGVAVSIYNVASAPEGERGREAAGEAVSWAAGLGGAWAVGKLGAAGGSFFGPWGTAIGGVGGAIVGGFFGGKAGHDVGTQAYDEINRPNH